MSAETSTVMTGSSGASGSPAQRERRRRILDATESLAREGGFEAVQMRAIAEHADVALGTLYRYFPSKIHLLVSSLARRFERAERANLEREFPGETAQERVTVFLRSTTVAMQREPALTEALTRAFMFADASVKNEIHEVGMLLTSMLTHAMGHRTEDGPSEEDIAVAKVIGDVWLSALVAWVTGRATAEEVTQNINVAVGLILRD